jgi:hypothetical protein
VSRARRTVAVVLAALVVAAMGVGDIVTLHQAGSNFRDETRRFDKLLTTLPSPTTSSVPNTGRPSTPPTTTAPPSSTSTVGRGTTSTTLPR